MALIEADFGYPSDEQILLHNLQKLPKASRVKDCGIVDNDVITVVRASNQPQQPSSTFPSAPSQEVEKIRSHLLNNPHTLENIKRRNPELAASINNPAEFQRLYIQLEKQQQAEEEKDRQARIQLAHADPFDIEAQKKIEEEIRKENIHRNYQLAMEYHPESFGRVVMLYVNVEVNGHKLKAFVDSGAQATIMSIECAKKCNIMHLLDERFSGTAEGVGTAKIIGRVHSAQIKIGKQHLPCSFTIMEGKMDFLFGLDMLKRHLACIDLAKNCLVINDEEISFLPEHEIPSENRDTPAKDQQDSTSTQAPPSDKLASEPQSGTSAKEISAPIQKLMDLGVSFEEAVLALQQTNGDVDAAASLLFM
ncbi:DNA damage-inducible protein 1 [Phlyctochytrium planicorne]|nr:DNA damage-inducible protein 1 [Phlyctochytrium planicorne]